MKIKFSPILMAFVLATLSTVSVGAQERGKATSNQKLAEAPSKASQRLQKIVKEGIQVEFTINGITNEKKATELMEGEDARVQFKVSDTATSSPVTGLNLSAWISLRQAEKTSEVKECREKVQSYLQGSLSARPDVDLNTYYVLALNSEPNISVIDPLLGFGGSKLYTLVMLKSPGEDWALTADRKKLFVSMPLVNQVAVVDTTTWKVVANIDTGARPMRIGLQPDEKYMWVANDSGATVVDVGEHKMIATVELGAGPHEMAFSSDNRYVFATNKGDGTLSVIDVQKLAKIKEVKVGAVPTSVVLSPLSKAVYVVSETEGNITVVDSRSHEIVTRMEAKPGLRQVRF
ncbi:MAG: hypothetical protein H0T92_01685, partial [Pyrinomonadaceae bacterium]|nr:hypothetical protein [Pyrinomonadaceae bacterium]